MVLVNIALRSKSDGGHRASVYPPADKERSQGLYCFQSLAQCGAIIIVDIGAFHSCHMHLATSGYLLLWLARWRVRALFSEDGSLS